MFKEFLNLSQQKLEYLISIFLVFPAAIVTVPLEDDLCSSHSKPFNSFSNSDFNPLIASFTISFIACLVKSLELEVFSFVCSLIFIIFTFIVISFFKQTKVCAWLFIYYTRSLSAINKMVKLLCKKFILLDDSSSHQRSESDDEVDEVLLTTTDILHSKK